MGSDKKPALPSGEWADILVTVGALSASSESMGDDISDLKKTSKNMAETMAQQTLILERIERKVDATAERIDGLDCQQADNGHICHSPSPAWKRPIGEVAGDIVMKAIYVVGIGAVVSMIILAVSAIKAKS